MTRRVIELETKLKMFQEQLEKAEKKKIELEAALLDIEEIQKFVQALSNKALSQFSLNFEQCVTECLNTIFPNTFIFKVITKVSMGKCKCEFQFFDYNTKQEIFPLECCGGGVLDLISFALKLAVYAIKGETPVMIMDEPFKFLSKDKIPLLRDLLELFRHKYQFIIVTHEPGLLEMADNLIML